MSQREAEIEDWEESKSKSKTGRFVCVEKLSSNVIVQSEEYTRIIMRDLDEDDIYVCMIDGVTREYSESEIRTQEEYDKQQEENRLGQIVRPDFLRMTLRMFGVKLKPKNDRQRKKFIRKYGAYNFKHNGVRKIG